MTATLELRPIPALPPLVETDETGARQALRAQLAVLERRLAAAAPRLEEAARAGAAHLPPARPRRAAPRLLDLAALECERDSLYARVRVAERAAVERDAARTAARARLEAMLADPAAHPWERVSREDLGEPGCGEWHVRPRAGLLGMLAGWWEVKLSSGCP
jgi:hypothetical protein